MLRRSGGVLLSQFTRIMRFFLNNRWPFRIGALTTLIINDFVGRWRVGLCFGAFRWRCAVGGIQIWRVSTFDSCVFVSAFANDVRLIERPRKVWGIWTEWEANGRKATHIRLDLSSVGVFCNYYVCVYVVCWIAFEFCIGNEYMWYENIYNIFLSMSILNR